MLVFPVPFFEAAHFTPANRSAVDLVVLHSMEHPEKPGTSRAVAGPGWFGRMCADPKCSAHPFRSEPDRPGPKASATYCVDDVEVVQCVRERDVPWGAPGANRNGIHIEHAGYAAQSAADWRDEYSMAMLHLSVELCAVVCKTWGIPATVVTSGALLAGGRGITTHAQVSLAFGTPGGHTDPGQNFPLNWYASRVASLLTI